MPKLGVNIDHVATLRQARREFDPDPLAAALICQQAGAHHIVAHLREDRRHIHEQDVRRLKKSIRIPLNLEMSLNSSIVKLTAHIKPQIATIVPERRQEITTEGGLDVIQHFAKIKAAVILLRSKKIAVSLFIDPVASQIKKAKETGAGIIEFHTGRYDQASTKKGVAQELQKMRSMVALAKELGLHVSAGHGLKYHNVQAIARIKDIEELNIGHAIVSRAIFVGLENAVKEMLQLIKN